MTAELPPPDACFPQVYEEKKTITFVWPKGLSHTGFIHVEWRQGWSLRNYLHSQPLRQYPLLGLWKRCRRLNSQRQRVKLNYVPPAGDTIVLSRVARPMS